MTYREIRFQKFDFDFVVIGFRQLVHHFEGNFDRFGVFDDGQMLHRFCLHFVEVALHFIELLDGFVLHFDSIIGSHVTLKVLLWTHILNKQRTKHTQKKKLKHTSFERCIFFE